MEMPGENLANLTVLVLLALLVVILLSMAIRIVPEYQRLVMFRLGRVIGALGPGLVLMIPFVDRGVRVDLRGGSPWHRDNQPARGGGRHAPGRSALQTRADQRHPACKDGRSDQPLGHQGDG